MSNDAAGRVFRIVERNGPGGRLVLRSNAAGDTTALIVAGYRGPQLPTVVTDPEIAARTDVVDAAGRWRLSCREGAFDFEARTVDRLEERPSLYEPLHRRFALKTRDRIAARALLLALRLPGGPRLLRNWHARRST